MNEILHAFPFHRNIDLPESTQSPLQWAETALPAANIDTRIACFWFLSRAITPIDVAAMFLANFIN
ncbi:MAG: hypothetical protein K6F32_02715 [Bacilli bacterium]|nr:hypothetical protein [Bacilli bacterium]